MFKNGVDIGAKISYNQIYSNKLEICKKGGFTVVAYVLVNDRFLERKLVLELKSEYEVFTEIHSVPVAGEVLITDGEAVLPEGATPDAVISDGGDLPKQFRLGALRELLLKRGKRTRLILADKLATLDGEQIRLTELEGALLRELIDAGGELVCRDTLCERVFGGAGNGMLNLYVHYLREKLERSGERVILSSRRGGYRISEEFL